jgi:hypothetical protein
MRWEKNKIGKIRSKKGEVKINTKEIQGLIRDYNKLENPEEMGKFLDIYDYPKISQADINHLNRSIIHNEIEATIKSFPKKEKSGT